MGLQGQSQLISLVLVLMIVAIQAAENATTLSTQVVDEMENSHTELTEEEFRKVVEGLQEKIFLRILEAISSVNDTKMQHAAKKAVARYLVNVTLTVMTKPEETVKSGKKVGLASEISGLPISALPQPLVITSNVTENETQENSTITSEVPFTFAEKEESSNDTELPSSGVFYELPVSSMVENQTTTTTTVPTLIYNETTTLAPKRRPIWEEILNFNFSAALMRGNNGSLLSRLSGGEGGSLLSRLGGGAGSEGGSLLSRLTGRNNETEGGNFLSRLNLTGLGGGSNGGNLLERLNLTGLGGGGNGGNLLERLNLTGLGGGGERVSLLSRLNLTGLGGGGQGGSLLSRLNLTALGSGGGGGQNPIFTQFAALRPSKGNGTNETRPGLPFNLPPPPEGLFNYPTPPPMNDSVRMSQMKLGNQVEKLMGDIKGTNLTGIVESTLNIATPSTVGVLVNALLNIVLCNPLDRFHGNCGVE